MRLAGINARQPRRAEPTSARPRGHCFHKELSMTSIRKLFPVLCLLLLTACAGSSVSATRYLLPPDGAAPATAAGEPTSILIVRPIQMADFLNADGIVLQLDDITLNQASAHLWAEQPALQLQRGLRQRLANRLPDTEILDANTRSAGELQLHVEVSSFQGTHNGEALAAGQWQLRNGDGEVLVQRTFRAATWLTADGYPVLVRALGRSWDQLAEEIAAGILAQRQGASG